VSNFGTGRKVVYDVLASSRANFYTARFNRLHDHELLG
jgi:hypothetical protein